MKHGKTWTNQAEEQLVAFMILLIANNMCEFAVVESFDRWYPEPVEGLRIPPVETTVMQTYWTALTKFVKPLFKGFKHTQFSGTFVEGSRFFIFSSKQA